MFNFFLNNSAIKDGHYYITDNDYNHIKNVLRMKVGDQLLISADGVSNLCKIDSFTEKEVIVSIVQANYQNTTLPIKIYLFQGLPKSDKMELIIQKAVELGVYEIIPVAMKNCVAKLDDKKAASKIARWQEIAKSAAKQSKRSLIPEIKMPVSYKLAVQQAKELDLILVPYENERGMQATREVMSKIKKGQTIRIFIGPEGGFDTSEIDLIKEEGHLISLGNRILRTETAGLAALSMLVYQLED